MAYYTDLFSPETYEAFSRSPRNVSGFRKTQIKAASRIKVGDKFICYMTKLSRWIGVLKVESAFYEDDIPLFFPQDDPFVIRFKITPLVWLAKEAAIPIHDDRVWSQLSFTQGQDKTSHIWTGRVRRSLNTLSRADGQFLEQILSAQQDNQEAFPIDEKEYQKLVTHRVRRVDGEVTVSVPGVAEEEGKAPPSRDAEVRESIQVQALLAQIGAAMGMRIWIPAHDRLAVLSEWESGDRHLLTVLPLNYDDTTLRTIEQIDVLWLSGRSIVRAFEVEHTTSIYSGILRMADLLALQPNMDIKLHIVAPYERRDKVFEQLQRPVFSLLERAPLSQICTFLAYDSVRQLSKLKHLRHLSDSVLEDYAEPAE
ncbi:MAG: hypothetical protein JXM73_14250 [Anaerolineae bacterium]|nr:hypothetical protein [Anaerolineae bacterium]